jgi:predicted nucleotidyltransferase
MTPKLLVELTVAADRALTF